ncbi:MAG: hypothetical protein LAO06_19345 [Acidobacteriia bacterium]|nr:hypothetical protein [Terriglobia bacterium]
MSLAEKTIDDLLTVQGLEHERETFYPKSNCRFDFVVGDLHIEYFGLMGDMRYEAKVKAKLATCGALGLKLLPVYPKDLLDLDRLAHSIKRLVNRRTATKIAT